jgi:glucokinase
MRRAGGSIGRAVAAAANLVNPQIVVIGGGVAQAGDVLLDPVREAAARCAVREIARDLRIVAGELGHRAGLLGAAALALCEGAQ